MSVDTSREQGYVRSHQPAPSRPSESPPCAGVPRPCSPGCSWPSISPPRWTEARREPPPPREAAPAGPAFTSDVRPLLKTYCFECHNTTKRKAGLDLEQIDTDAAALDLVELWDQVGERLRAKEMPPAKSKQPTEDERRAAARPGSSTRRSRGWTTTS